MLLWSFLLLFEQMGMQKTYLLYFPIAYYNYFISEKPENMEKGL